jgi:hypothetical protein
MLPSQGLANLLANFDVGVDFVGHSWNAVDGWLSDGGRLGVDFSGCLRERGLVPVLSMGLNDVRGPLRRPSRVETQGPRADFELANSRSFLAQMAAQGATMDTRFMFEAFTYLAGEKDFELHHLEFWFRWSRCVISTLPCVPHLGLNFCANCGPSAHMAERKLLMKF